MVFVFCKKFCSVKVEDAELTKKLAAAVVMWPLLQDEDTCCRVNKLQDCRSNYFSTADVEYFPGWVWLRWAGTKYVDYFGHANKIWIIQSEDKRFVVVNIWSNMRQVFTIFTTRDFITFTTHNTHNNNKYSHENILVERVVAVGKLWWS